MLKNFKECKSFFFKEEKESHNQFDSFVTPGRISIKPNEIRFISL